jgi:Beta-lactamase class A
MNITDKIKDRISNIPGEIGIYYYDLKTGNSCFVGNCDVFPSLGIAKLILLIEVYRQAEEGLLSLSDEYILKKESPSTVPESEYEETVGILDFLHEGMQLTVGDLVHLMMVISDNSAFNILLSIIGMENVNNTMKKLGLVHTRVGCFLFEWDVRDPGKDNYHSVREVGSLLKRLYKKQLISISASESILRLLSYHQRREVLSSFSNQKITVAQQTGFDINSLHEAAVVMSGRPFIICMSINHVDSKNAELIMKDIAGMCCEASNC